MKPTNFENTISVRQMSKLLKRFHLNNGDILAIKHQTENANEQAIDTITKALTHLKIDALVIVVDSFDDLTVLNETEMGKRGWFKLKSLSKFINVPTKDVNND